ncbi:50S ribosomal protein L24 [Marinithermus hydrothermalis]|uniref:Large ribosomal subunit protein uL24 n=1 Tax=Marinithermus hydrothermalis (strain DSM 14884 / JCM 11576 / T1) TaxID=869210 RepID=F2NMR6_MARHT|nr:50S ribosomal protein L24 [Marinithermus hydrothermalis]AEB12450.1 ribosomal protein L24 [Marinithermus hydrothermalis DSM 14884]
MRPKLHVKRGDTVIVVSGKDRGKTGKVIAVYPKKFRVLVEGVNIVKKAVRPTPDNPQGGFREMEAPLHAAKVRPVCPNGHPVRVKKKILEDGTKVRVCHRCGAALDG